MDSSTRQKINLQSAPTNNEKKRTGEVRARVLSVNHRPCWRRASGHCHFMTVQVCRRYCQYWTFLFQLTKRDKMHRIMPQQLLEYQQANNYYNKLNHFSHYVLPDTDSSVDAEQRAEEEACHEKPDPSCLIQLLTRRRAWCCSCCY